MEELIIPLDGSNYSTWKIQIKMLLLNLSLWNIVIGAETEPAAAADVPGYIVRRGEALSTIVLSVSPSLLYLIGEPVNPVTV